jgi:hypothetical protein
VEWCHRAIPSRVLPRANSKHGRCHGKRSRGERRATSPMAGRTYAIRRSSGFFHLHVNGFSFLMGSPAGHADHPRAGGRASICGIHSKAVLECVGRAAVLCALSCAAHCYPKRGDHDEIDLSIRHHGGAGRHRGRRGPELSDEACYHDRGFCGGRRDRCYRSPCRRTHVADAWSADHC